MQPLHVFVVPHMGPLPPIRTNTVDYRIIIISVCAQGVLWVGIQFEQVPCVRRVTAQVLGGSEEAPVMASVYGRPQESNGIKEI